MQLIVFTLEQQPCALHLEVVEKAVRAVEISPLPRAPSIVDGVVNVRGRILPVINLRRRFGLPQRALGTTDQFIIARSARRTVCLLVDDISAVSEYPDHFVSAPETILPGLQHLAGVVKLEDGLLLIHDLDSFLSADDEVRLTQALASA